MGAPTHLLTSSRDLTKARICLWPLLPSIMLRRIWEGETRRGAAPFLFCTLCPHSYSHASYLFLVLILQFCIQEVQGHRLPEVGGLGEVGHEVRGLCLE